MSLTATRTRSRRTIIDGLTEGISPKAVLAFLFPLIAAVGASAASWVISGDLNVTELRVAAGGFLLSSLSALGAWLGRPGTVTERPSRASVLDRGR